MKTRARNGAVKLGLSSFRPGDGIPCWNALPGTPQRQISGLERESIKFEARHRASRRARRGSRSSGRARRGLRRRHTRAAPRSRRCPAAQRAQKRMQVDRSRLALPSIAMLTLVPMARRMAVSTSRRQGLELRAISAGKINNARALCHVFGQNTPFYELHKASQILYIG